MCQYPLARILNAMSATVTPIRLTLKDARDAAGLTQSELAERVGVRQATISDLETGKSGRIDLDVIERLCRVLKIEPGDLIVLEPKLRSR